MACAGVFGLALIALSGAGFAIERVREHTRPSVLIGAACAGLAVVIIAAILKRKIDTAQ
jgi:hypothetical protein